MTDKGKDKDVSKRWKYIYMYRKTYICLPIKKRNEKTQNVTSRDYIPLLIFLIYDENLTN